MKIRGISVWTRIIQILVVTVILSSCQSTTIKLGEPMPRNAIPIAESTLLNAADIIELYALPDGMVIGEQDGNIVYIRDYLPSSRWPNLLSIEEYLNKAKGRVVVERGVGFSVELDDGWFAWIGHININPDDKMKATPEYVYKKKVTWSKQFTNYPDYLREMEESHGVPSPHWEVHETDGMLILKEIIDE